jgi:ABC-type transport system involved in multi-copper enzyme maturation permease subunit
VSDVTRTLRAEWTKFRTVRGWVIGTLAAAGVLVALGLPLGAHGSCGTNGPGSACPTLLGPGGEEVTDSFTFVHQPLAGDGSITVRIAAFTGLLPDPSAPPGTDRNRPGLVPWAKAGLIVKSGTAPGSTYAAVMMTGDHGVRMQADYVRDTAGAAGAAPRWLRLTRAGDTVTGAASGDGIRWTTVGATRLPGLPSTAEVGLFVTSPQYVEEVHAGVNSGSAGGPSQATGTFDHLTLHGGWAGAAWRTDRIGGPDNEPRGSDGLAWREGETFRLSGSGDIAPAVPGAAGAGLSVTQTLVGTFAGLIIVVAIGAAFVTSEYRRGLIRTTLAATPARTRVLVAKAAVLAAVTFVVGLVAAAAVVVLGQRVLRAEGVYVHPASAGTQVRIVIGTGALLAVAAVLALALGTLIRGSVTAITAGVVVIVLPYVLAVTVLPDGVAAWMLRISPAAAFAVQQAATVYPQVSNIYTPAAGYFPLPGWAGFAVLAGWTALAFGAALVVLDRRDA